jgi:hypothetical protein
MGGIAMKSRFFSIFCQVALIQLIFIWSAGFAKAAEPSFQDITDKFFKILAEDKGAEAIDYIFSTNAYVKGMVDQINQVKSHYSSTRDMIGLFIDKKKLFEREVAGIFVFQYYLVAYERQPLAMRFWYYKPLDSWVLQQYEFEANVEEHISHMADMEIFSESK